MKLTALQAALCLAQLVQGKVWRYNMTISQVFQAPGMLLQKPFQARVC